MKRKITLKSIAKELDVSISTVSKALKDSPEIGKDTKERIQAFANFYNYRPNNIALSLKNSQTKTIGIIIPEITHHFFTKVIKGIEYIANQRGYNIIICLSNNASEKEVINFDLLGSGRADGFILSVAKETQLKQQYDHLKKVIAQGMPVVMFDRVIDKIACDKVIIDDTIGAQKAVQHLIDHAGKRLVIISTKDYISVGKLRTQGYINALTENNIPVKEAFILKIDDQENPKRQIERFLADKAIDGVFAVNEKYAVNAVKALKKQGKKIPHDVSVIGFTDGEISKNFIPGLTTVNQHGEKMGQKAANLLINQLESESVEHPEKQPETAVIDTNLIIRNSVKK